MNKVRQAPATAPRFHYNLREVCAVVDGRVIDGWEVAYVTDASKWRVFILLRPGLHSKRPKPDEVLRAIKVFEEIG